MSMYSCLLYKPLPKNIGNVLAPTASVLQKGRNDGCRDNIAITVNDPIFSE